MVVFLFLFDFSRSHQIIPVNQISFRRRNVAKQLGDLADMRRWPLVYEIKLSAVSASNCYLLIPPESRITKPSQRFPMWCRRAQNTANTDCFSGQSS